MTVHPKALTYLKVFTKGVMFVCLLFVCMIMIIWLIAPELILVIMPEATMKFNTALSFLFIISGILLSDVSFTYVKKIQYSLYVATLIIAISSLFAYIFNLQQFFLNELFVLDPFTAKGNFPGQMSISTAVLFIIISIVMITRDKWSHITEALCIFLNLLALTPVIAFFFDFEALYSLFFFSSISIHTALLFVLLSAVIIVNIPTGSIHRLITLDEPGGSTLRWLLPIELIVPFGIGWLILQGMHLQLYEAGFAISLCVIIVITIQFFVGISFARNVQKWYEHKRAMHEIFIHDKLTIMELENIREMKTLKDDFLAKLSHDMRSPITTIVTSSDIMLKYRDKLTEEQRIKHIERVRSQALNMLDFVEDIMLLSRLEFEDLSYELSEADIVYFCRNHCQDYFKLNYYEKHQLILDMPSNPIQIKFNPKLIRRLLNNLLSNAIKYSPEGGNIYAQIINRTNAIQLSVRDEGIGIPEEDIDNLFQLFRRASNVSSISGHGLGLPIMKQIADIHHATISVESTIRQGTNFTVVFPY